MKDSIPSQLRFPAFNGFTIRADFEGGALSSDFRAVLWREIDKQSGLITCLAGAIQDRRHASYVEHQHR